MATPRLITFHDSYTPFLTGGRYAITVHQEVRDADGRSLSNPGANGDQFPEITQRFEVHAPRFALPPGCVHATHPPSGATGPFDNQLAHVSLTRLTLPWEQILAEGADGENDGERAPWLALLVFAQHELPGDPQAQGTADTEYTVADVLDLRKDPRATVLGPDIDPGTVIPEVLQGPCRTIDVPAGVFTAIVPRFDELNYLTHVREVAERPTLSARAKMSAAEFTETGQYSIVLANRFPRGYGNYAAHLVSLEGFADCLKPEAGPRTPDGIESVRLVSLLSWSFTSHPDPGGHFSEVVHELALPGEPHDDEQHPNPDHDRALSLRLPPPADADTEETAEVGRRLRWGYVPVSSPTAEGERTFAWYRGPLIPVPPPPLPPGLPPFTRTSDSGGRHARADAAPVLGTPDGLMIYLPQWGVFDLSYAVAWTMGRLLALSHAPSRYAQKTFRRKARTAFAAAVTRLTTPPEISGLDPGTLTTAAAIAHPRPATDRLHTLLADGLANRLSRRHAAPPPRDRPSGGPTWAHRLRTVLADSAVSEALTLDSAAAAGPVGDIIDGLAALELVPFDHLVADRRMLPPESVRFCYVDPTWITALVDGFVDAGVQTTADTVLQEAVLRRSAADANTVPWPEAGLLLRSRLARDWPGLIIEADRGGRAIEIVRREYLAPDLLLCLFAEVPDRVTIAEPHQDLYIGAQVEHGELFLDLRYLAGNGRTGAPISDNDNVPAYLRTGTDTMDIHRIAPQLTERLRELGQLPDGELTPAGFAVQLIQSPVRQTFRP
ncbi:hypothetical protein [Nocardia sp. alder85J]|uniref:hypothetical protein n=1 Tax=Nocardia sp. alder85J TaxID=2862949 RepID=UPI001CD52ABF|nr:hypothetical protein [Nocardia sp. alder85J]MCX4096665.1 hypothetical protein [Nocardia sp. alder85J]